MDCNTDLASGVNVVNFIGPVVFEDKSNMIVKTARHLPNELVVDMCASEKQQVACLRLLKELLFRDLLVLPKLPEGLVQILGL